MTGQKPLTVGLILLGLLIGFNAIVTVGVLRDSGLSILQKIGQILLVWVIPLVGASVVLAFLGQNHTRAEMRTLVPSPFHLAGHTRRERDYNEPPEGVCG